MIHVRASLYDLNSPPACGSYSEGEKVIGWYMAIQIVETGEFRSKTNQIEIGEMCEKCLNETANMLFELSREIQKEQTE